MQRCAPMRFLAPRPSIPPPALSYASIDPRSRSSCALPMVLQRTVNDIATEITSQGL